MIKDTVITVPDPTLVDVDGYIELNFNEFMSYSVGTSDMGESNIFLNSLWRIFNKELSPESLEHCPWYYVPQKLTLKNMIITYFGSVRTNMGYFHVAVSYKKKGRINNIHFLPFEYKIDNYSIIEPTLKKIIKKARKEIEFRFKYIARCEIRGQFIGVDHYIRILDYGGNNYNIKESILEFIIYAQDIIDAKIIASNKLRSIINFISVETNLYFTYTSLDIIETTHDFRLENLTLESIYQNDLGEGKIGYEKGCFIDLYPSVNSSVALSKEGVNFIDRIISTNIDGDDSLNIFLSACYHFRQGVKREILINQRKLIIGETKYYNTFDKNQVDMQSIIDASVTHYLSAIETATLIGHTPAKCEACGQLKYQINKRVQEFISLYLWETHGEVFKKIYNLRSTYLHKGISYSTNYDIHARPLLDSTTGTGCVDYNFITLSIGGRAIGFGVENIREWTGYALRNFYKDLNL